MARYLERKAKLGGGSADFSEVQFVVGNHEKKIPNFM